MWHYKIVKNYYTTEYELNEYGEEGWELVTVSYHRLYFKKWVEPSMMPTGTIAGPTLVDAPKPSWHYTGPTGATGNTGTMTVPTVTVVEAGRPQVVEIAQPQVVEVVVQEVL